MTLHEPKQPKNLRSTGCCMRLRQKEEYFRRRAAGQHQQTGLSESSYDVAEDSWSHEVYHFGRLEHIDGIFNLQLMHQRGQSAERSCCDPTHTGEERQKENRKQKQPMLQCC